MTPAEEVPELVAELKPLIAQLQALLPDPVADATKGSTQHHKVTGRDRALIPTFRLLANARNHKVRACCHA